LLIGIAALPVTKVDPNQRNAAAIGLCIAQT
jgi:hypothetical protein